MAAEPTNNSAPDTQVLVTAVIVGGTVAGWGASTVWTKVAAAWHKSRCPVDAFSYGGLGNLSVSPPFAVGYFTFFLVAWVIVLAISRSSSGRSVFEAWSPPSRNPTLATTVRIFGWASALLLAVAIGCCSLDFLNGYCLSPSAITLSHSISSGTTIYRWDQVRTVETICWKGKRDPLVFHMNIVMSDGAKLPLPELNLHLPASETDVAYFPGIKRALRGSSFYFDGSAVEPACRPIRALIERP